jgi:hypothetical protein
MPRVFRLWLPVLVLVSVLIQSMAPILPGAEAFNAEVAVFAEEGDFAESDADPAKDVSEDEDDTKTLYHNSIELLSGQFRDSASWLNSLFGQHSPKSFVPPPRG